MDCDNDGGNDPSGDKEGAAGGNSVSFCCCCCCGPSSKIARNAMPRVSRNDMSRMPRMQPPVANVAHNRQGLVKLQGDGEETSRMVSDEHK